MAESRSHIRNSTLERRIIGGKFVNPSEFPHHVAIYLVDKFLGLNIGYYNHYCGGSIIKYKWVLTAAHCTFEEKRQIQPSELIVRVVPESTAFRIIDYIFGRWVEVQSIIVTSYTKKFRTHDLALLKLKTPDKYYDDFYNENVPALFPKENEHFTKGWASGLGRQSAETYDKLRFFAATQIKMLQQYRCREIWGSRLIEETNICIYRDMSDKFTPICKGDSGAGIVQKIHGNRWTIFAVNSFSQKDCIGWGPTVAKNVSYYLSWIKKCIEEFD